MGLCQKGLTSWRRSTEKLWELSFFLSFLSMSKILPRETNCDGPFYHRTAWTHEEDWCLIVICLCFSAFEWFQFSFTAWHACLPSTEHPPSPPTEAWCCALTLIYRTGLGRAQWSYLCLTKTLTWYIATYSFCGLSTAIQSEWAGGQRAEASEAAPPARELNNGSYTPPPPCNSAKVANWEGAMRVTAGKEVID